MANEIWDLYDASGAKTQHTMIRGEEVPPGLYHLAVHIWPVNSRGELLIQRRSPTVLWKPNVWAVTGGSAVSGEDNVAAALRELREEIGVFAAPEDLILVSRLRRSNSFCSVFMVKCDRPASQFRLQKEEVSAVRWATPYQITRMVQDGVFYNYGDAYFRMLFEFKRTLR